MSSDPTLIDIFSMDKKTSIGSLSNLNYNNQVEWSFDMKKESTKEIIYSYKVYIKK